MQEAGPVMVRRSLKLWYLTPVMIVIAAASIEPFFLALATGAYPESSRRGGHLAIIGIAAAIAFTLMIIRDCYSRYIRKDYLEFNQLRIVDQISRYRIGQISWHQVEGVEVTRSWVGSVIRISFKDTEDIALRLPARGATRRNPLVISQLEIAEDEERRILALAENAG